MMENYGQVSRRGLIKLNEDFDSANENMLLEYLKENDGNYEEVRPVEKAIEYVDMVTESADEAKTGIKGIAIEEINKLLNKMTDVVLTLSKGDEEINDNDSANTEEV